MGHFLAVSAFRDQSVESVASHTISYSLKHGVVCESVGAGPSNERLDAIIFAPQNRWTVVLWPQYFNIHDIELCRFLSAEMPSLASTVHVYDDDYWVNAVFDKGTTLSLFASVPEYFSESDEESAEETAMLKVKWSGDATAISKALSIPAEAIRPYFAQQDAGSLNRPCKAFIDDEFDLWNFWVFTDFWRRLGINYPNDINSFQQRLQFAKDFGRKLPCNEEQFEL